MRIVFAGNDCRGFETVITYNDMETLITYKEPGADRDTTIKTLNNVIKDDYEIRLCTESKGSDTLCFIPLSQTEWLQLENEFAQQVEQKFEKIINSTKYLSRPVVAVL